MNTSISYRHIVTARCIALTWLKTVWK